MILDAINKNGPVSLIEKNSSVSKLTPITDFEVN